jgi:hypothetical protein
MDSRYPTGRFTPLPSITAAQRADLVARIGSLPAELKAALARVPPGAIDRPYRAGGWTVRQVIHHLADSHMNAYIRFRLALTEDAPTVKPYEENLWAELVDAKSADAAVSLGILDGVHARLHQLLTSLAPADFARPAVHPQHGPISIDWLLQMYGWHGRHHIGHINLVIL